ncbi:hypothetical protein [Erythrobacter aureus]|uniref:hypothetical protein n=1 Tax=Erythrobacter aureus TaxID=2182384 RepID=UPI003A9047C8
MSNSKSENQSSPTLLGWIIRIASFAILAGLTVYLLFRAISIADPITLGVEAKSSEARTQNGQTLLPVEITNEGNSTIRDMELTLIAGEAERPVTIKMLGEAESITYTIDVASASTAISYQIESYESQ